MMISADTCCCNPPGVPATVTNLTGDQGLWVVSAIDNTSVENVGTLTGWTFRNNVSPSNTLSSVQIRTNQNLEDAFPGKTFLRIWVVVQFSGPRMGNLNMNAFNASQATLSGTGAPVEMVGGQNLESETYSLDLIGASLDSLGSVVISTSPLESGATYEYMNISYVGIEFA